VFVSNTALRVGWIRIAVSHAQLNNSFSS
jgi:hypothetical protein